MPPVISREPELLFIFDPSGTPVEVDMSCHAVAVDISSDTETVDVATFCNPTASELGRTTESIVVATLWSEDLYTDLSAHLGEEFEMQFKPNAADTKAIICQARYASLPWGRFELGQRVEADLALAVLSTITYATPS
jgi:extradiol dioxygenase family protein